MGKHAYLIMVHEYTKVLEVLLKSIDYSQNDIFLHVDQKAISFPVYTVKSAVKKSTLTFVPSVKVFWGGFSQIKAEMNLLKAAVSKGTYEYYHLLSGADLPLKSQKDIHEFFRVNHGKEFIRIQDSEFKFSYKVKYYHLFEKIASRRDGSVNTKILKRMNDCFLLMQRVLRVNRNHDIKFQKGTNWFSITDQFARYVVSKEEWIDKVFRYTHCADEIFLQTLLVNSNFKENLYHKEYDNNQCAIMRYIDWERGCPYTFRKEDFDLLINSGMCFARKFSEKVDVEVVEKIYNYIHAGEIENQ